MAIVSPQTDLFLLQVPLEIGDENQLTFADNIAQYNYFSSLTKLEFDNFTYQRKDNTIRIPANIEGILQYNYVMYRNTAFSNKWFYAFITDMQYLNDEVTAVTIKTDVWQTWQFDLNYKRTFVEREHVSSDTVGLHTVPENLETGEYIQNNSRNIAPNPSEIQWNVQGYTYEGGQYMIAFQLSELLPSIYSIANVAQNYNGIYSGLFIVGVDSAADALEFIRGYDEEGKGGAIISCFLTYPHFFNAGYSQPIGTHGHSARVYPAKTKYTAEIIKHNVSLTQTGFNFNTLNGYSPKNNKLKTYPYCYYLVDNNAGQTNVLRYELFKKTTTYPNPTFNMYGTIGQGNSIKLVPLNYKGTDDTDNFQEGIQAGKLPVCAWASDYYLNWVTQNAINMNTGVVTSAITGALSGNFVGAATSTLMAVINNVARSETAKLEPDIARGNINVCDLNVGYFYNLGGALFTIKAMSIRAEYAKIIDDFFSVYGYKVNEVKIPNITGRRNWNYVKTIGCYIDAEIPQSDLQEIKSMFDKGITLWHNPATFADYSQNNDII